MNGVNLVRCSSYDPISLDGSSRRSSDASYSSLLGSGGNSNSLNNSSGSNSNNNNTTNTTNARLNTQVRRSIPMGPHLSQTDNLIIQPQSYALSSAITPELFVNPSASLTTLNSCVPAPSGVSMVSCSAFSETSTSRTTVTTAGSTTTVSAQVHHPNENVSLEECDSDQPIENNDNLILPDEVVQYLCEQKRRENCYKSKLAKLYDKENASLYEEYH